MKFAKQLDEDAIPEWRGNYLDYKVAKKRLKAVGRAIRSVTNSTRPRTTPGSSFRDVPGLRSVGRNKKDEPAKAGRRATQPAWTRHSSDTQGQQVRFDGVNTSNSPSRHLEASERSPLRSKDTQHDGREPGLHRMVSYGSIIGSPPNSPALRLKRASTLELPGTAVFDDGTAIDNSAIDDSLNPNPSRAEPHRLSNRMSADFSAAHGPPPTQLAHRGNAYDIHPPVDISVNSAIAQSSLHNASPKRTNSMPDGRPFFRRMFSVTGTKPSPGPRGNNDVALEAYEELDFRKAEFFLYLDKELLKIETFYKLKENEAIQRLDVLREQLHIMRTYRLQEIVAAKQKQTPTPPNDASGAIEDRSEQIPNDQLKTNRKGREESSAGQSIMSRHILTRPLAKSIDIASEVIDKVRTGHVGKTSEAMGNLGTPTFTGHWTPDPGHRDYSRRPLKDVPYRTAKRKMKLALAEYYRGLELLKSYTLLNRTAYRKINKKYDKTVNAHRKLAYMEDKVNTAHFVTSDVVDGLLGQLEDLYARYFERGNRKVAASKLRAKLAKAGGYSGAVARTCALVGAGAVFAVQATVYAARDVLHPADAVRRVQAEYLLQLYAGYFLCLLLMALFCLDAGLFTRYKVNYQFIFEFDNRHHLDWLQLCELPSWMFFMFGLAMWLNFMHIGGETMYLYWFVVLIGLSVVFLFMPAPIMYHRARRWFIESIGRLLAAGIYPVEFRDFFLGDMFCSLTYSMGNIELFFCLYARGWNGEEMCNSSHSRLLGFLSALPGIWRAFQCLRRYWDTRNAFPHLANCGKYICTILMYMSLSLYRIDRVTHLKAFFIACATINAVYCSFWDIFMDWSLGDFKSKYFGLRPALAYRKVSWIYYVAVILDPILRFNWIFYAIYTGDVQHSTIVSFFVGFSEIMRRGMWTLFRVENEHCSNIARSRASRNVELPYHFSEPTSTENLLETDKQKKRRSGIRQDSDETKHDSDNQSLSKLDDSADDAVLPNSSGNALPEITKLSAPKPDKTSKSSNSVGDGRSTHKPASQASSPQTSRTQKTPTERSDVATPFRLLNIHLRNAGAAEAPVDTSAVDTERGPRTGTDGQTSDGRLQRTETSGSGGLVTSLQRIGNTMRSAHAQDYEKRKKPEDKMPPEDSDEEDDDESGEDE